MMKLHQCAERLARKALGNGAPPRQTQNLLSLRQTAQSNSHCYRFGALAGYRQQPIMARIRWASVIRYRCSNCSRPT